MNRILREVNREVVVQKRLLVLGRGPSDNRGEFHRPLGRKWSVE